MGLQPFARNPNACVSDRDEELIVFAPGPQLDLSLFGCVLGGIVEEIGQYLCQAQRIGLEPDRLGRQLHGELVPAPLDPLPRGLHRIGDDGLQFDLLPLERQLSLADATQVDQVLDHPRQVMALPQQDLHRPLAAAGGAFPRQDADCADDRGQGISSPQSGQRSRPSQRDGLGSGRG